MSCCSTAFGGTVERQFSDAIAARDLNRYRTKGPAVTTRLLLEGLAEAGHITGSLLDIGTGIGSLAFELIDAGVTAVTAVDASRAYIEAASREAARRSQSDAIQFHHADFLEASPQLAPATIVTLDRVICCYAAAEPLLREALRHAEAYFAFSYPKDVWYVRAVNALINGKRHLTGNPFRTFIHSAAMMEEVVAQAGFRISTRRRTWTWCVDTYIKEH